KAVAPPGERRFLSVLLRAAAMLPMLHGAGCHGGSRKLRSCAQAAQNVATSNHSRVAQKSPICWRRATLSLRVTSTASSNSALSVGLSARVITIASPKPLVQLDDGDPLGYGARIIQPVVA